MAGFKSILSTIGGDAKKVFAFFGSTKGQQVIQEVESGAVVAAGLVSGPAGAAAVTGFIGLANRWITEIFKAEALATAAGQQNGSGAAKEVAVISTIAGEAYAFCAAHGFPEPTIGQLAAANTALVAFGNALYGEPVNAAPAAVAPAPVH